MDVFTADSRQHLLRPPPLRHPVDESEPAWRMGDADIVGHGKIGQQRKLLKDARYPRLRRLSGSGEADRRAAEKDAPAIRLHHAREDLDERGLARPILPQ